MKSIAITSGALLTATLFFSGCSVPAPANLIPGKDVTGNWQFTPINDSTNSDKLGSLAGSLLSQGTSVTGVLHGSGCVAATQDIAFSGTNDANGNLTLTSTNLANNVATITGTVSITPGGMFIQSSLAVTGSGPCAMAPFPNFEGAQIPPLDGSFTANLTSATGATATLTANLTAAAANADGQVPETGTFTLATATCSSSFSFAGEAIGNSLQGTLTSTSGSTSAPTISGQLGSGPPGADVTLVVPNGSCAAGSFTGPLLAQ